MLRWPTCLNTFTNIYEKRYICEYSQIFNGWKCVNIDMCVYMYTPHLHNMDTNFYYIHVDTPHLHLHNIFIYTCIQHIWSHNKGSVLQCVAVCCSVLQYVAVCRSVLQCAAVCCSMCLNRRFCQQTTEATTEWRIPIGYCMFIGHFPQESPIRIGSCAERDLELKSPYASLPPCEKWHSALW